MYKYVYGQVFKIHIILEIQFAFGGLGHSVLPGRVVFCQNAECSSEIKPAILAKSLGTLSQKHRKFMQPPFTPNAMLI